MMSFNSPAVENQLTLRLHDIAQALQVDAHRQSETQQALQDVLERSVSSDSFTGAQDLRVELARSATSFRMRERAALLLSATLSETVPAFSAALRWPQVQSFGDRLIQQATDTLCDSLDEDELDGVYAHALLLLPANWCRLHAGLAVAEEVPANVSDVYVGSAFCMKAEDRVANFALGPFMLLSEGEGASLSLSAAESEHAKQTCGLVAKLYPSFPEELKPVGDVSSAQWEIASEVYVNNIFSRSVVAEAKDTFSSPAGGVLLFKFPEITTKLNELAQSFDFTSIAEQCVEKALQVESRRTPSSGPAQAA